MFALVSVRRISIQIRPKCTSFKAEASTGQMKAIMLQCGLNEIDALNTSKNIQSAPGAGAGRSTDPKVKISS